MSAAVEARRLAGPFAELDAIDGAEAPGDDELLPAGPRFIDRSELWQLAGVTERLWGRFDEAVRHALGSGSGSGRRTALARELGFDERAAALIGGTPSLLAAPVRADFVPTANGPRLVEWNVDPCLGGIAGRRVLDCFLNVGCAEGAVFHDPAAAIARSLQRLAHDRRPLRIAIRRADRARWGGNAERLAEAARAVGLDARVATVEEVVRGERDVDVVRQFFLGHAGAPEVLELLRWARAGRARLVYGFDTELWGDKQWLARVRLPDDLRAYVPETLTIRSALPSLRTDRHAWVLKPHAGAAGEDVLAGREASASAWSAALERALAERGWVAQRLVEPAEVVTPYVDAAGRIVEKAEIETLSIFLVDGHFAGAYSRTKPAGDGVVIDSSSRFNVVVTPGVRRAPLEPAVREPWTATRIDCFQPLAREHLARGGGTRVTASPAEAGAGFPRGPLPEDGAPLEELVETLRGDLLPFCHDKRHAKYLAHLDVPPADLSIAAGTLVRALAQDPVTWTSSRAGSFIEEQVLGWLTDLAFPGPSSDSAGAGAVACSGGTQANLLAVLLARNLAFDGELVARRGLAGAMAASGVRALRVIASEAIHGSVSAAVRNAGLGDESLVRVPVDAHDRLRLDGLEEALDSARRDGDRVALVVLNAGTVGVGAIDPLPEAIALAHRHGARVHVDAAHGAMLLWSRRYAGRLAGLSSADSVTADPHKILGLNQGLGTLLLRNLDDRRAVAKDAAAPYFSPPVGAPEASRFTLDGTRPLHALAAFILLRHLGRAGYEKIVDHLLGLTERFTDRVSQSFELYAPPAMNLVAFRPPPGNVAANVAGNVGAIEARLEHTRYRLSRYQSARGPVCRAVFVNPATTDETVDELAERLSC